MDQRELARLLIKIAGVVIAVWGISTLPYQATNVTFWLNQPIERAILLPQFWALTVVPGAICIAIGASLFLSGGSLAKRLVPKSERSPPEAKSDWEQLEQVAVAVLGLYFVADSLSDLTQTAGIVLSNILQRMGGWWYIVSTFVLSVLVDFIRLAIGIALMLRGHVLVSIRRGIVRMRTLGVE